MLPLPFCFAFAAAADFFALPVRPCLPIVGKGSGLLGFAFVAMVGGGALGGTASLKGVFAGVPGGVGGLPVSDVAAVTRGFLNMSPLHFGQDTGKAIVEGVFSRDRGVINRHRNSVALSRVPARSRAAMTLGGVLPLSVKLSPANPHEVRCSERA